MVLARNKIHACLTTASNNHQFKHSPSVAARVDNDGLTVRPVYIRLLTRVFVRGLHVFL